jgi:hypothetical protein
MQFGTSIPSPQVKQRADSLALYRLIALDGLGSNYLAPVAKISSHFIEFLRSVVYCQKSATGRHASFDMRFAFSVQSARHLNEKISCVMSNPHLLLARRQQLPNPPQASNYPKPVQSERPTPMPV